MNTSTKFRDFKTIQKIGFILIVLGAVIILLKIIGLLSASHFIEEDIPNYLFLTGAFLFLLPMLKKLLMGRKGSKKASILLLALSIGISSTAQNYSKQIAAFEQSFTEKSVSPIQAYLSPTLKFDPIPVANTPAILKNIVSNLPKLNSMTILESAEGKAKIKYDFVGLGVRESYVHFDEEGKFTRIELIENLIKMELEAQKKMRESVQTPTPGPLGEKFQPKNIEFKTSDGLLVNGNLYEVGEDKPVILLCHQAGYNRVEYADIAPKLNEMGYNCLAIDQRSGGNFADKPNVSAESAKEKGLPNEMIDARADIKAAIDFLHKRYKQKVIVWGSSYSSSLALLEGVSNDKVKAIIAFSPGDYFGDAAPSLSTAFSKADKPFLVTSSKEEASALTTLMGTIKSNENQSQFIPESSGFHGSKALWTGQKGAEEYWNAVTAFLNKI
ncbi:alpha/beta hydrolase [Winogradskyella maritima]|uniref:Alpha/beta hydrolase n=1 Tax=Winogradskyella maritima TaxID=1517766 RepID=A0ABV8AEF2_9FLAO|nr:alpha/beta hydrolase [Winogradskyella maritima]